MNAFSFGDRVRLNAGTRSGQIMTVLYIRSSWCTLIDDSGVGWAVVQDKDITFIESTLIEELLTHPNRMLREKARYFYDSQEQ